MIKINYNFLFFLLFSFALISCIEKSDLANDAPESRTCGSSHPLVGSTGNLSQLQHGVSGLVTIVSDCEIRIDNFNYDGGGPNVRIYGAFNARFSSGFNLSEQINGRRYTNESLSVFLPIDQTLDDINSFSVWCFEFRENFGSVNFF